MNLPTSEKGKRLDTEALCEGVDARMAEEGNAFLVGNRDCGIVFECLRATKRREVVAFVEVFEEGCRCCKIILGELNTVLSRPLVQGKAN